MRCLEGHGTRLGKVGALSDSRAINLWLTGTVCWIVGARETSENVVLIRRYVPIRIGSRSKRTQVHVISEELGDFRRAGD